MKRSNKAHLHSLRTMSNTEATLGEMSQAAAWNGVIAQSLDEYRERARKMLQAQRERLQSLQGQLSGRIAELADEVGRNESQTLERSISLESREASIKDQLAELQRQRHDLSEAQRGVHQRHDSLVQEIQRREQGLSDQREELRRREEELERMAASLTSRQQVLDQRTSELAQERARFEDVQRVHKEETEQLTRNTAELRQIQAHYEQQKQALEEREQEIARQRRNIARQLRARKKELTTEKELMLAEARSSSAGNEMQLQQRIAELSGKYERLSEDLALREQQRDELNQRMASLQTKLEQREAECARLAGLEAQVKELEKQRDAVSREREALAQQRDQSAAGMQESLDAVHREVAQHRSAAEAARAEAAKLAKALDEATRAGAPADLAAEIEKLRHENRELEALVREAESRPAGGGSSVELDELRSRLEMAMQDCRDLKNKNAELQQQLDSARLSTSSHTGSSGGSGDTLDWEAQKRRLLAQLEADSGDEQDEGRKQERLSIQDAIQRTDQAIAGKQQELASKQQEIEELRRQLEEQAGGVRRTGAHTAAAAEVLDRDELIRQERESLQQLQTQLREQLRQAEIELSMDRAKIARERMEMEEKLHAMEKEKSLNVADAQSPSAAGKKPARGRWLERLGLRDGNKG